MKVWIALHGEYSARHIVAVCSTHEHALRIASQDYAGNVEEWEIDAVADRLLAGWRRWMVTFNDNGDVIKYPGMVATDGPEPACDFYDLTTPETIHRMPPHWGEQSVEIEVITNQPKSVVKIASERRRIYLATQNLQP